MSSSEIGYIFDFLAGVWIIQSIIFRSQKHIEVESQQLWDGNPLLHEAQLKAFYDGWLGSLLLLIGLIFHLTHIEEIKFGIFVVIIAVLASLIFKIYIYKKIDSDMRKKYESFEIVKRRSKGLPDS